MCYVANFIYDFFNIDVINCILNLNIINVVNCEAYYYFNCINENCFYSFVNSVMIIDLIQIYYLNCNQKEMQLLDYCILDHKKQVVEMDAKLF